MQHRAVFQTGIAPVLALPASDARCHSFGDLKRRGRPIKRGTGHNQGRNQIVVEHDK